MYVYLFLSLFITLLGYYNSWFFVITIMLYRVVNSTQFFVNDLVCYGMYDPFVALKYANLINVWLLVESFVEAFTVWLFLTPSRYMIIYSIFTILGVAQLFYLVKAYPENMQKLVFASK